MNAVDRSTMLACARRSLLSTAVFQKFTGGSHVYV